MAQGCREAQPLPGRSLRARTRPTVVTAGLVWLLAFASILSACNLPGASGAPASPTAIPPTATPRPPTAEELAAQRVATMTLDDKLGQLIIIQYNQTTYGPSLAKLQSLHPGGVILYGYSMGTAQQVKDLLAAGQKDSPIPMFTFLDLEGGYVDRLAQYLGRRLSAPDMANTKDPTVAAREGAKTAKDLLSFGFNADLAPDTDVEIAYGPDQSGRSFGKTPDVVSTYAGAWLDGLQGAGVVGCLKHFPGLGAAATDAHTSLPVVNRTRAQLDSVELAPYKALIASGQAQMIMSTDVLMPAIDPNLPAELSKAAVTGVLRGDLGYKGVAITDALYMDGISARWPFVTAAVMAIEAGNDMIMAPFTLGQVTGIIAQLKADIASGKLTQTQVDASVTRILALKMRSRLLPGLAGTGSALPTVSPAGSSTPATSGTKTPGTVTPSPHADMPRWPVA